MFEILFCYHCIIIFFQDSVRSAVNTIMQFFFTSGILLQYCAGPYISYLQLIIVSITPCIFGIMLYPWLRESPYYLVYKNDTSKAISNLQWLRGGVPQSSIEQEIKNIQVSSNFMNIYYNCPNC